MRLLLVCMFVASTAAAEPCPQYGLAPSALLKGGSVTLDGGILVAELPEMVTVDGKPADDRSKWRVHNNSKLEAPASTEIAPGLFVYKPPSGPRFYDIVDGKGKQIGKATVTTAPPAALPAPRVRAITSGQSRSKHVNTFVDVELDGTVPDTAVALVVAEPKGRARSWGRASAGTGKVNVYSTQGGCISVFPNGTVISQPGDRVVAFWVDTMGRRSPQTPTIIVEKP